MNNVLIIPTGIGAEIGGHAGDANPVAKLIASVSDTLITHPNVVNASDVNEMTENTLYVEGSLLDRFLLGNIELERVKQNKILVVVNSPIQNETINAVSSGRVTIGIDAEILVLNTPLEIIATMKNGVASGDIYGVKELIAQVENYDFDALAITSEVKITKEVHLNYFKNGGVNPWGGAEAKASRLIVEGLNKPVAHAPLISTEVKEDKDIFLFNEVVDPRIAPEMISFTFLHCVLKGLHKAPRIGKGLSVNDVDCLISPYGCYGTPHFACEKNNIPIIMVKENRTVQNKKPPRNAIIVENYLEAVGVLATMKAGVTVGSVRRPIKKTKIIKEK